MVGCSNCYLPYLPTWDFGLSCGSVYFKIILEVLLGPGLGEYSPYDMGGYIPYDMGVNSLFIGTPW